MELFRTVRDAYAARGITLDESKIASLRSKISAMDSVQARGTIEECSAALFEYVIVKSGDKYLFGDLATLDSTVEGLTFAQTLGAPEEPCLNLARTYWTFKVRTYEAMQELPDTCLAGAMLNAVSTLEKVFFPDEEFEADDPYARQQRAQTVVERLLPDADFEEYWQSCPKTDQEYMVGVYNYTSALYGEDSLNPKECAVCGRPVPVMTMIHIDQEFQKRCATCVRKGIVPPKRKWFDVFK